MTKTNLQISLQKSNSTSLRKDRIIVRRTQYDSSLKRSKALGMLFSCKDYEAPIELPADVIEAHCVTKEEQEKYNNFVCKMRNSEHSKKAGAELRFCCSMIKGAVIALSERSDGVSISEIEAAEVAINELKAQLARHKKNAKKRERKEEIEDQQDIFGGDLAAR